MNATGTSCPQFIGYYHRTHKISDRLPVGEVEVAAVAVAVAATSEAVEELSLVTQII